MIIFVCAADLRWVFSFAQIEVSLMKLRLNKIIAQSGISSRRKADELILEGKVKINGEVVTSLGVLADPEIDKIEVSERPLKLEKKVYILLHKPKGYTTTTKDIHAEKTVFELLPKLPFRLYPVGRLDKDTSGLLILTNDGLLSYQLTHPKFEIDRVYEVLIKGGLLDENIKNFEKGGLLIDDYKTSPCKIKIIAKDNNKTKLQLTLHEGRKHQIRKMFVLTGHQVIALKRIQFGKLKLDDLKEGKWKYIKPEEII